jgi:hypothetical protein
LALSVHPTPHSPYIRAYTHTHIHTYTHAQRERERERERERKREREKRGLKKNYYLKILDQSNF